MKFIKFSSLVCLIALTSQVAFAQEKNLAAVNIADDLGVNSNTVATMGFQVQQARHAADAVGLIGYAYQLKSLEAASNNKSKNLTSVDILNKAADLIASAKDLTPESFELKYLKQACADFGMGDKFVEVAKKLEDKAAKSSQSVAQATNGKADASSSKKGFAASTKKASGYYAEVQCYNYSDYTMYVYIDGDYENYVSAGFNRSFYVVPGYTSLYAEDYSGTLTTSAYENLASGGYYTWNIY